MKTKYYEIRKDDQSISDEYKESILNIYDDVEDEYYQTLKETQALQQRMKNNNL